MSHSINVDRRTMMLMPTDLYDWEVVECVRQVGWGFLVLSGTGGD